MEFLGFGILTWITFLPVIGMVVVLLLPKDNKGAIRWTSAFFAGLQVILAIVIYMKFNRGMSGINTQEGFQFVEKASWIDIRSVAWFGRIHIEYLMGIDGLSVLMVILTALISFIAVFASWPIDKSLKGYFALLLLLDAGMMGVFVSLDFFLFYVFWELMLRPMYFLIGIWGGPRREYAAIKFFLYTLLGSVLMMVTILYLYFASDPHTFDMTKLATTAHVPLDVQILLWVALFIGFAIKIPAFPFHTWLPDAHVEAPTAISVILAGVLLKMGTYGILRINYPMLPAATADLAYWFLGALGAWNIIYGALCAMAQKDLKKLVAYSSVSHMGYVMLGMASFTTQGINGAVLQMFNHGTITGMLFLLVGVVYDRAHHRDIEGFGGLAAVMQIGRA